MANRKFVMLADEYDADKHRSAGMWLSTKLDGMRAVWIPETVGKPITEVPFANLDKKTKQFVSTGLWSRYGNPIMCPPWFTQGWPDYCVDGELWLGNQKWDELMSAVKKHEPIDSEWKPVKMHVFEKPHYEVLFRDGMINEGKNFSKKMVYADIALALGLNAEPMKQGYHNTFDFVYRLMCRDFKPTHTILLHEQVQLPFNTPSALVEIQRRLDEVTEAGGEGLILRHPGSEYDVVRSKFLLKIKKLHDAEATVIGYRAGQGKYTGMLGSLRVRWEHGEFELSGMLDVERVLTASGQRYAAANVGELLPNANAERLAHHPAEWSSVFPVGTVITFRYRELTTESMPKEGRYLRKHQDGGADADSYKLNAARGNA